MEEHRGLWAPVKELPTIKQELRSLVPLLNYNDVRRQRLPLYGAIVRELLEDGCTECAEHFERLADMETHLFEMRIIKSKIYNTSGLLEAIIDNARIAEKNCKILHNHSLALKTLFQTAMLLDRREGNEYNWLTKELYLIVNNFVDKWSKRWKYPEIEARSRYYFGKFLLLKDHNYTEAIEQLKNALELSKCKQWYTAKDTYNYLSMKSRVYLCKAYLCEADRIQKKDKVLAEELATYAIMAVWEGRLPKDIKLYCEASLRKGFYSIRLKNFEQTLSLYKRVQPYIYSLMLPEFKCEMLLHQGICYFNLKNDNLALRKLKQSIRLGEIYKLRAFHAHALVQIGKLYSKSHNTYNLSHKSFKNARDIYIELNDHNNVKKVNYLAAKLKSQQILPQLVDLIRNTEHSFCDLLTLRAWKDQLEIFWKDDYYDDQKDDTIGISDDENEFKKHIEETVNKDQDEMVDLIDEKTEEVVKDMAEDMPKDTAIDVPEDMSKDTPKDVAKDAMQDISTKDSTKDIPNDMSKDILTGTTSDSAKTASKDISKSNDTRMSTSKDVSKDTEESSNDKSKAMAKDVTSTTKQNDEEPNENKNLDDDNVSDDSQITYKCIFKRMQ